MVFVISSIKYWATIFPLVKKMQNFKKVYKCFIHCHKGISEYLNSHTLQPKFKENPVFLIGNFNQFYDRKFINCETKDVGPLYLESGNIWSLHSSFGNPYFITSSP